MAAKPVMSPSASGVQEVLLKLDDTRRLESETLIALMVEITGESAVVWSSKIVGCGQYRYRYDSGHCGVAPLMSFMPGKRHLSIYLAPGFEQRFAQEVAKLGPHTHGVGCLYVKHLSDIDPEALRALMERSVSERLEQDAAYGG